LVATWDLARVADEVEGVLGEAPLRTGATRLRRGEIRLRTAGRARVGTGRSLPRSEEGRAWRGGLRALLTPRAWRPACPRGFCRTGQIRKWRPAEPRSRAALLPRVPPAPSRRGMPASLRNGCVPRLVGPAGVSLARGRHLHPPRAAGARGAAQCGDRGTSLIRNLRTVPAAAVACECLDCLQGLKRGADAGWVDFESFVATFHDLDDGLRTVPAAAFAWGGILTLPMNALEPPANLLITKLV